MELELKKEFLDRMKSELSNSDYNAYLDAMKMKEKHGLTVNMHKLNKSSIDLKYIIEKFNAKLIYQNNNFSYLIYDKDYLSSNGVFPGKDPLYHVGLYYIQEPSASKVLYDVDIEPSEQILDLCASPGGKTSEILFSLSKNDGGFLVSNEINFSRAKILSSNIERLGFDNVAITCSDSNKLMKNFQNYFDKVIVDAPCSGEGMFRKSEEARLQWSIKLVESMSIIQKNLLKDAYSMLKPGGILIYSTCTFAKKEDENVVSFLLNEHSDMKLIKMEKNYPFNSVGEGQFYAILKKDIAENVYSDKSRFDIKSLEGLNVVRVGINEFSNEKKTKIPTHASTHIDDIKFENVIELNDEYVEKYLRGEAIRINLEFASFCKVTYKNLGLGLAKYSNGVLKNHYPKGLRNK